MPPLVGHWEESSHQIKIIVRVWILGFEGFEGFESLPCIIRVYFALAEVTRILNHTQETDMHASNSRVKSQDSRFQDFKMSRFQDFKISRFQDFQDSTFQVQDEKFYSLSPF